MSLNGLEELSVQEAYQFAVAEAGGWFFLKYASRDSVELLDRGKGGLQEARQAIARYEETSPLYGVIVYRRRKVLLKYIPEGTSRLLQARTAVHFQAVSEKYSPYETVLEITTPEGLNDHSLAASFPLHTASPSASSHRLDEITEDGEDSNSAAASEEAPPTPTAATSYFQSQRNRMERRLDQRMRSDRSILASGDLAKPTVRPASPRSSPLALPAQPLPRSDAEQQSSTSFGTSSLASMADYTDSEVSVNNTAFPASTVESRSVHTLASPTKAAFADRAIPAPHPPRSTSLADKQVNVKPMEVKESKAPVTTDNSTPSERGSISERPSYDDDLLAFLKPKVKLAPRPVTSSERTKRPTTASISTIPAAYKINVKKQEQPRPKSQVQQSGPVPTAILPKSFPLPPPIPNGPEYNPRPISRGSVKSLPSHKSTTMTPDKIRLMKAVELRKRQLRKSNPQAENFVPPPDEEVPAVPKVPDQPQTVDPPVAETVSQADEVNAATIPESQPSASSEPSAVPHPVVLPAENQTLPKKADSGIDMVYEKADKQNEKSNIEDTPAAEPNAVSDEVVRPHTPVHADPVDVTEEAVKPRTPVLEEPLPTEINNTPLEPSTQHSENLEKPKSGETSWFLPESPKSTPADLAVPPVREFFPPLAKTPRMEDMPGAFIEDSSESEAPEPESIDELGQAQSESKKEVSQAQPEPQMPERSEHVLAPAFEFPERKGESTRQEHASIVGAAVPEHLSVSPPAHESPALPTIVTPDHAPPHSSAGQPFRAEESSPIDSEPEGKSGEDSADDSGLLGPGESSPRRQNGEVAWRRRGFVEPMHVDGDTESLSGDEFLHELQSATVHEAKPIMVSKSPYSRFYRTPSAQSDVSAKEITIARSPTIPPESFTDAMNRLSPEPTGESRPTTANQSVATPTAERSDSQAGMKRNVSSGISKRIQALAEMSNREAAANASPSSRPRSPEVSQNSLLTGRTSPHSRTSSFKSVASVARHSARLSSQQNLGAVAGAQQNPPIWTVQHDTFSNRDSVSVTARIVRPTTAERPDSFTSADSEFRQPQLTISHKRGASSQAIPSPLHLIDTNTNIPQSKVDPTSPSKVAPAVARTSSTKDSPTTARSPTSADIMPPPQPPIKTVRKAATSPTADDFPPPPSSRTQSSTSTASNDEPVAPKESTRTSRFFKRMSSMGGGNKRRSVAQPASTTTSNPVAETSAPTSIPKEKPSTPPAITVGDLNIQFPDTLLWKRRIVAIDTNGYLTFSEHQRAFTKRFPLSEFKPPYIPDRDREELPNSVMLDFNDGTTLQIACEDYAAQRQVVQVLKTYWKAWSSV